MAQHQSKDATPVSLEEGLWNRIVSKSIILKYIFQLFPVGKIAEKAVCRRL